MAAQRVGGGYSYGLDPVSGSPRRPQPVAPKGAVSTVVKEFDASGVRAIEVIQGGATLWTAEEDGSIAVRNGFTGEVAHRTQTDGSGLVERLYATNNNLMWVGMNDGGVKVYDSFLVDVEWPPVGQQSEKPHTGPVHFFCPIYDGSMLSGSTDGLIIKWEVQENVGEGEEAFKHIRKATPSQTLSALEAYSTYIFAGDLSGNVYVLDTEFLHTKRFFEAHPSATVTCLKYMDGLLFSGGSEGTIAAWSHVTQRDPDKTVIGDEEWHASPIRKLIGDPRAHQMWSVDDTGKVRKWESTAPFGPRNSQSEEHVEGGTPLECGPFQDLTTFASWDAVRVWSTGSNGANFSWFAQWSRAEEQMREAIDGMQVIINRDQAGLDAWQRYIDKIRSIDERRKKNLAHTLLMNSEKGALFIYKRKWHMWLQKKYEINRRGTVADCLSRNMENGLLRLYYDKLFVNKKEALQRRQKMRMVESILGTTTKGLRRIYWKKINIYRHKKKQEQHRLDLAEALLGNSDKGLMSKTYKKFARFFDRQKIKKKRQQVAESLFRSTDIGLIRVYYFKLVKLQQVNLRSYGKRVLADAMMSNTIKGMQRIYYLKFWKWGQSLKAKEKRKHLADLMKRNSNKGILAVYQQKCDDWLATVQKKKKEKEIEEKRAKYADLLQQQEKEKVRMKRIEALDEIRQKRDALKARRDGLLERIEGMNKENDETREAIKNKAQRDEESRATRERLNDIMAKLKEMSLNFDSDYQLIISLTDKCKSIPVHKLFLQAHMEVKRVVILVTKKEVGENWSDIYGKFKKLEKFQYASIYKAIKTLVIAFDIMTLRDLDMLDTDDEIVANAQVLMKLYENAARIKNRQPALEFAKPAPEEEKTA